MPCRPNCKLILRHAVVALSSCAVLATVAGAVAAPAEARKPVYYTDHDSEAKIRPLIVDGSGSVRAGPFRHWRGWGTAKANATVRYRKLRTTVIMRQVRTCAGRRQYRLLYIYSYRNGKALGRRQRFVNRACQR